MIGSKLRKVLVPVYIMFLVFSFFYVRSVLKGVPVSELDTDIEKIKNPQEISVDLKVLGPGINLSFKIKPKDNDSVADLLLKAKEENESFIYDRIAYSYGYEFDHVNNIYNNSNSGWRIFVDDRDITMGMDSEYLQDGKTYTLQYVKKR